MRRRFHKFLHYSILPYILSGVTDVIALNSHVLKLTKIQHIVIINIHRVFIINIYHRTEYLHILSC